MTRLTPLQWAVLFAYSHALPHGPERQRVRTLTDSGRPARCGPALVLSTQTGMTRCGRITEQGKRAARDLLARLDSSSVTDWGSEVTRFAVAAGKFHVVAKCHSFGILFHKAFPRFPLIFRACETQEVKHTCLAVGGFANRMNFAVCAG